LEGSAKFLILKGLALNLAFGAERFARSPRKKLNGHSPGTHIEEVKFWSGPVPDHREIKGKDSEGSKFFL
jgi:hypothetical protein